MSCQSDFQPCKQRCLLDSSSRHASSSTRRPKVYSSTSLPSYSHSSPADLDNTDLLDPLSDVTLDSDPDQGSASSATLLSQSDLPARPSRSRQSCFFYPLHEPGQMTVQRTQRLRARIASVIMSMPATCEDVVYVDEREPRRAVEALPVAQASKLRRVSGVRDLRRAFRVGDHEPARFPSISSLGLSQASYEFGVLSAPIPMSSSLSRPSLRTLVDLGNALSKSSGDLKTLCGSTLSSVSIACRIVTKVQSSLSLSRSPHAWSPTDTTQAIFPRKHFARNLSVPRPRRRTSLHQDTRPPRSPGKTVWSCAKISQSTLKLAARRGHLPRRVFSHPVAVPSS